MCSLLLSKNFTGIITLTTNHYRHLEKDCSATEEVLPIGIIYPKSKSKIYVPIKLDGTLSKTVFEASHRDNSIKIYWHLDDAYLGETTRIHQMELIPEEGKACFNLDG